jgi:ubiquinone/menaquinone biosynthesis C-methylase UbiE/uncharacterized protein YbaR (Trm112 family)
MKREHIKYLVCPQCKNDLALHRVTAESTRGIESGGLRCTVCAEEFTISGHIPRLVSSDNYAGSFGAQWRLHSLTQLDSHTGVDISRRRFFEETQWPARLTGDVILEVGGGAGRFTEQATATGAMVISVDLSEAVDVNYSSHGHLDNLLILQADIYRLPFKEESFDKVFCFGVLQHTPDVEKSFKAISRYVRRDGELAIDVYRRQTGLRRFLETKYWVRPLTTRMPQRRLYEFCRKYVACMWPVAKQLRRIPRIGRAITYRLLIPDYHGQFALSDEALKEWAILDMFDMLSPAYDQPQSLDTVRRWFDERFRQVDVRYGHNGIQGRGVKSTA